MSRSRMNGAVIALFASGALLTGCAGSNDGFTAAESAPTPAGATPAPAAGAATPAVPAQDPSTKALGAYIEANPSKPTFRSYDGFSRTRAGKIFVSPVPPKVEVAPTTPTVGTPPSAQPTPVIQVPVAPSNPSSGGTGTGGGEGTVPVPTPGGVSTGFAADIDVSGASSKVKVGDVVSGQFTVQAITADTMTLKLNSGTFPGGSDTVQVKVGESSTLTHPTAGSFVIAVKSISPEL